MNEGWTTRDAEPVFKKVIQHFSSHNLFVLMNRFIFSSFLDFAISDFEEDAIDVKDNQDVVEVAKDKKNSLKFMKMMCIYFLIFSFSIIFICLNSDESLLPVPSQYYQPQVP